MSNAHPRGPRKPPPKDPEHEVEVRGFVDLRLDDVGEWGEEDPGAITGKDMVEQLSLRTCTGGDVVLRWNGDKAALYEDQACTTPVLPDDEPPEGVAGGWPRNKTFTPTYPTPDDSDGWGARFRTRELWLKAAEMSDTSRDISLGLWSLGEATEPDEVRLTVGGSIYIGASDETDDSMDDDWVAMKNGEHDHRIPNYLIVKGARPGAELEFQLGYQLLKGVGSITIDPTSVTVATDPSGYGFEKFYITGGENCSTVPENVEVQARLDGRLFAAETLTVIWIKMEEVTCGKDPIPANPAVVNEDMGEMDESPIKGNLFAVIRGRSDDKPTIPGLGESTKVKPGEIEVQWAKKMDSTLQYFADPPPTVTDLDPEPTPPSRFRMRDTSLTGWYDDLPITYYFGHPSCQAEPSLGIETNYAAKITAHYVKPFEGKKYPLRVHVLKGPTLNPGLTGPQVVAIMEDVTTIWSQAGITFNVLEVSFPPVSDDLLQVDDSGEVTGECYTPDAIDVIFVHSFRNRDGTGETLIPNPAGPDWLYSKPGCVIAGRAGFYRKKRIVGNLRIRYITRCVAHELGHYIMNSQAHRDASSANLMYGDTDANKRDISKSEADAVRNSGVTPSNTDPD